MISRKAIVGFGKVHPDAFPSLSNWFRIARRAGWKNFADLREDFGSADQVDRRTVFNIGGNKYRLIARVNFRTQRIFVLAIMKHDEYDRGAWK